MTGLGDVIAVRSLVATEDDEQRVELAALLSTLGHRVLAAVADPGAAAAATVRDRPDVAVVGTRGGAASGLAIVRRVAEKGVCPVVAVLPRSEGHRAAEAAASGAHAVEVEGEGRLEGALAIAMCRFADYRNLQDAFARRAVTERAKGMLMERHRIGEQEAFAMLRSEARGRGRRLADMAQAVLDSHGLLAEPASAAAVRDR